MKLCIFLSLTAVVAVGAVGYRYKNEICNKIKAVFCKMKQPKDYNEDIIRDCMFSACATRFSGMYESLYRAVHSADEAKLTKLIDQWHIRIISQSSSALSLWWRLYVEPDKLSLVQKGNNILSMIVENGIKRDDRKSFVTKAQDLQLYRNIDNEKFEEGMKVIVESPCWYLDTDPVIVVEQGYVENQN